MWFRKRYRLPFVLAVVAKLGAIAALAYGLKESEKHTGLVRSYFQPEQVIDNVIQLVRTIRRMSA
ncbi:hypothetical protein GF324_02765 [bacterium]|nr:hypothetical protein [bacterium]